MESKNHEANSNFGTGDREDIERSGRAESGESRDQTANHSHPKGDGSDDAQESETEQAMHFTPVIPGEHQINRPGRRAALALIPPLEELPRLWAKQDSELNVVRAEKKDLQRDLDSLVIRQRELQEELSDLKRVKNGLEPTVWKIQHELEQCNLENEQLKESNEGLRWKVHEIAAEVGKGRNELSELLRTNDRLLGELQNATDDATEREKAIEASKAEIQAFVGIKLSNKVLEVEVDKLKDDLMKAREQINDLVAQQHEMAMEIPQTPADKPEGEGPMSSLEAEMGGARSDKATDRDEEEEYLPDDVAFDTKSTLNSEPVAKVDTTEAVMRTFEPTSRESQGRPEEIKHNSKSLHPGCASRSDAENKAAKVEITTYSAQSPETPVAESNLTPPERYLSEPSPLSLTGLSNSLRGKARPSRPLLSLISELEASDFDRLRTDSPAPRFAENTPEIKAKPVSPLGFPVQIPRAPISGATTFYSDTWPSLQADKIFNLSTRRRRPAMQGWSESRPGDSRLGKVGLPTLGQDASNVTSEAASTTFDVQTHGHLIKAPGQTEGQSTQSATTEGNSKEGKCKSNIARTVQYSSIAWWLLLLSLALSWWCSEDDRQLWMQANKVTRQNILGWRDERWAEPSWLARMSFDVEHMLQIDMPLFV